MPKVIGRNFGAIVDVQVQGLSQMIDALQKTSDPRTLSKIRGRATVAAAKSLKPLIKRLAPVANPESVRKGAVRGRLRSAVRAGRTRRDKEAAFVNVRAGKNRADLGGAYYRWVVVRGTRGTRDVQRRDRQAFYVPLQEQGYTRKARYRMAYEAGLFNRVNVKPIIPRPFLDLALALGKSKALAKYTETYENWIINDAFKNTLK